LGEYVHGVAKAEGNLRVWVTYGPILPDVDTKNELNFKLREKSYSSELKGTILPQKKEIKSLTLTPQSLLLEGPGGFSVAIDCKNIVKIENSASDGKAIKIKSVSESKSSFILRYENIAPFHADQERFSDAMYELGYRRSPVNEKSSRHLPIGFPS
jgi:hypothetical protein